MGWDGRIHKLTLQERNFLGPFIFPNVVDFSTYSQNKTTKKLQIEETVLNKRDEEMTSAFPNCV